MKVTLAIVKGPEQGRVLEFAEPRGFVIGRAQDADLRLGSDDPYVSRRHIYLEISPPNCRLRNLGTAGTGSTNPPHVNGKVVLEDCDIQDGDVIELGYTQLKVSLSAQVEPQVFAQVFACAGCGFPIEWTSNDDPPQWCDRCARKAERQRQEPAAIRVSCSKCGVDLTDRANSDGRASALRNAVVYSCERCLPRTKDFRGTSIGPYEVLLALGEGGMGAVYLAYHGPTARVVAVKQMKDLKDAALVKRFEREMRLMQSLSHDNIVRCIDVGADSQGKPFLVTEYVAGGDLESMVQPTGRIPAAAAVSLISQVLVGIEYLHGQQIIHRDIKPPNILLRPPSRGRPSSGPPPPFTPKVADFGLAFSYARAGGTRFTKPRTGMGTLMYTSPEQVRDATTVREPADVYSVGVTLYHLLTGRYTFEFPTPQDVIELQQRKADLRKRPDEALRVLMLERRIAHPFQIILSDEPVPIQKRDPSVGRTLAEVVDKAVRKDPNERFQTAAEFRAALEQIQH